MLSSPAIYFRPQNFSWSNPKKIGLLGWSSTGRKLEQYIAVVDGGVGGEEREKHPILVVFSLQLYGTPMFWSRGTKAGNKLTFVSRICLLQLLSTSTRIWQSCQAFDHLGSCIFSRKELDFSSAWRSLHHCRVEGEEDPHSMCCLFPQGFWRMANPRARKPKPLCWFLSHRAALRAFCSECRWEEW